MNKIRNVHVHLLISLIYVILLISKGLAPEDHEHIAGVHLNEMGVGRLFTEATQEH